MSKSYKVAKKTINMGEKKGQTLFSVRPYSYGTLTTEEVANQIAVESTATPADVKAGPYCYAYYVKENLKKGYDIELLGFGKLFIRFITGKAVVFAMASPSSPAIVDITCDCIFVSFIMRIKFVF